MRIESFQIEHYGLLKDFACDDLNDHKLCVILGANESGKSTFFDFLVSMFFGFSPATLERHPYAFADHRFIGGQITLRLGAGETAPRITVSRRLAATARATLTAGKELTELGNRALPELQDLGREVYRQLFALTADDMGAIGDKDWARVESRLIAGAGQNGLRPANEVKAKLQKESASLWRLDRRGKPRARQLEDQIKALHQAARQAKQSMQRRNELRSAIAASQASRDKFMQERRSLKTKLETMRVLAPILRKVEEVKALRAESTALLPDDDFPPNPRQNFERLCERSEDAKIRALDIARECARLKEQAQLDEASKLILEREELLMQIQRREYELRQIGSERERLEGEIQREEGIFETKSAQLGIKQPEGASLMRLRELNLPELREKLAAYDLWRTLGKKVIMAGVLAFGLALFAAWLEPVSFAQALICLAIIAVICNEVKRRALCRELAQILGPFAVLGQSLEHLNAGLLGLENLQASAARLERLEDRVDDIAHQRFEFDKKKRALLNHLNLPEALNAEQIDLRLNRARAAGVHARHAQRELREKDSLLESAKRNHQRAQQEQAVEVQRLARLAPDGHDAERGLRELERARRLAEEAEFREESLAASEPHWRERYAEAKALEAKGQLDLVSLQAEAELEADLNDCEDQLDTELERLGRLKEEAKNLAQEKSSAEFEADLACLTEELEATKVERDQLELMGNLIAAAEAKQSREFRPQVLALASRLITAISLGRYEEILEVHSDAGTSLTLRVSQSAQADLDLPSFLPISAALSRGLREQVYFSFRLALGLVATKKHQDRIVPPFMLDDVFVNWDRERRQALARELVGIAKRHQVFLMTCHEDFAQEMQALGAQVIKAGESPTKDLGLATEV